MSNDNLQSDGMHFSLYIDLLASLSLAGNYLHCLSGQSQGSQALLSLAGSQECQWNVPHGELTFLSALAF